MQNYPVRDCREVNQRLSGSDIYSGMDMKSGFLNVAVTERARKLLGIVT